MHRGSAIKLSSLTAGISNVWLVGEINGNYTPFGYPFNWRELNLPINQGPKSFGGWSDGVNLAFIDGSVKFLDNGIDQAVLKSLADAAPLPANELFERPIRQFELSDRSRPTKREYFAGERKFTKGGPPYAEVFFSQEGQPEFVDFVHGFVEVESLMNKYPHAKTLRTVFPESAQELELICSMKELVTLCLMREYEHPNRPKPTRMELSELIKGLKRLLNLRFIKLIISEEELIRTLEALPNCEVVPSSNRAPYTQRG